MGTYNLLLTYVVFVVFLFSFLYFMNNRKKKKENEMIKSIKIGDKIVTVGGIHGSINKINDMTFEIKIDKGVSMTISKGAVARVEK